MPALGRFGPLALAVAALAAIRMAFMAWSHMSWRDLQNRGQTFDTLLAQTRLESLRSQWLAEQLLEGRIPADQQRVQNPSNAALQARAQLPEPVTRLLAEQGMTPELMERFQKKKRTA